MKKLTSYLSLFFLVMTSSSQGQALYTEGHADIGIGFESGELEPHWHIEGGTVDGIARPDEEFEPGEVIAVVPNSTVLERPVGSEWDFIGVGPGENYWSLPSDGIEASSLNAPFLGLATEELSVLEFNSVTLTLTGFSGPGDFSLYQNSSNVHMATYDGLGLGDSITIPSNLHVHRVWAFSAPGDYDLTFTVTGDYIGTGTAPGPAVASFGFIVVPEPSTGILGALALAGFLLRRRHCS